MRLRGVILIILALCILACILLPPTSASLINATSSKGGVFNGGFETGSGSVIASGSNANGWLGLEQYGWHAYTDASGVTLFDANISHSGSKSLKINVSDATGKGYAVTYNDYSTATAGQNVMIPLKISTTYRLSGWIKVDHVPSAVDVYIQTYNTSFASHGDYHVASPPTGTTDWAQYTTTFTTQSDEVWGSIWAFSWGTGNPYSAWFDDIALEEVVQDIQASTVSVRPVIKGVTSTDNIDQSQLTTDSYAYLGSAYGVRWEAQSFVANKSKLSSVTVYSAGSSGSPVGNVLMQIQTDSGSDSPSGTTLASDIFSSASWGATGTRTFNTTAILSPNTKYWIVLKNDTPNAASSYFVLCNQSSNPYTSGIQAYSPDLGLSWTSDTSDFKFLTNYAKNTETASMTVNGVNLNLTANGTSVSDPDGLLPGAQVNLSARTYNWANQFNHADNFTGIFTATPGGYTTSPLVIRGWGWTNGAESIQSASDTTPRSITVKANSMVNFSQVDVTATIFNNNVDTGLVELSHDNVTYTTVWDLPASASPQTSTIHNTAIAGNATLYIRVSKDSTNGYIRVDSLAIDGTLDTTGVVNNTLANWQVNPGTNTYNLSSNGQANSSSLDPSMQFKFTLLSSSSSGSPPTAGFNSNITTGATPMTPAFNDTSTGAGITSYNISFGVGEGWYNTTSFPSTNITHTYSSAGVHTVNWSVTNAYGTSYAQGTETVYDPPTVTFYALNTVGTAPFTTYFFDTTSSGLTPGPDTYYWDFGDGNTTTTQSPLFTYNITGTYTVRHSVNNSISKSWNNKTAYITVGTPVVAPAADFYGSPSLGGAPLRQYFTDTSSNTPTAWNWTFGDGAFSDLQSPMHIYTGSGFFRVNLTVSNLAGTNTTSKAKYVKVF